LASSWAQAELPSYCGYGSQMVYVPPVPPLAESLDEPPLDEQAAAPPANATAMRDAPRARRPLVEVCMDAPCESGVGVSGVIESIRRIGSPDDRRSSPRRSRADYAGVSNGR